MPYQSFSGSRLLKVWSLDFLSGSRSWPIGASGADWFRHSLALSLSAIESYAVGGDLQLRSYFYCLHYHFPMSSGF